MTEAGWTSNAPTKEGWYWWQRTENDNPVVVWVNTFHPDKQLRAEMISGRRELLTHFSGLFKGPLSPTDRQQGRVAGARECVEKVRARAALWRAHGGAKIGFPYGHLTVEGECDSIADELGKFAQQAQEGGVGDAEN